MQKLLLFIAGLLITVGIGGAAIEVYDQNLYTNVTRPTSFPLPVAEAVLAAPSPDSIPRLTIDSIFSNQNFEKKDSDAVLLATGDIIPARLTDAKIRAHGAGFPFEKIEPFLKNGDLVVGNLEAPLIKNCPLLTEGMVFCGIPLFATAMKDAHINVATLENNHIQNYGESGKNETRKYLEDNNITAVIAGAPRIVESKGIKIGFIAADGVGSQFDISKIAEEIKNLRPLVDVVTVSVHWGKEYTYTPEIAPGIAIDDPQVVGHSLIDAGADLILGNHPHWVQGVELYKSGFITYAHGNFIFDQEWSEETKEGVIGAYTFRDKHLINVNFTPIVIESYAQPSITDGVRMNRILEHMEESSKLLQAKSH